MSIESEFLTPKKRWALYWERRTLADAIKTLAPLLNPGIVMDVGCGMKPYAQFLETSGNCYWGLDYPVTMERSYRSATAANFFGDSLRLPVRDAVCDSTISTQVLEHVPDPSEVVRELTRILKPGGTLLLAAPMTWPLHEEPFDFYRYTGHGLRHLLKSCGMECEKEIARGNNVITLAQMFLETWGHKRSTSRGGKLASALVNWTVNQGASILSRPSTPARYCLGWVILARKK